jgi:PASTA domain
MTKARGCVAIGAALALAVTGAGVLAGPASAYIYWGDSSIQTTQLDGSNQRTLRDYLGQGTIGIALDSAHIYLADSVGIERANLDGSQPPETIIPSDYPVGGVAVDGAHIYWVNYQGIGRANLDGTSANAAFITLSGYTPQRVAVDGTYIYWTASSGVIGRALLNGSSPQPTFITLSPSSALSGIAVNGSSIYWTTTNGSIGRANLDGTSPQPSFIPYSASEVALDGSFIYWFDPGKCAPGGCQTWEGAIGRANLSDGASPNPTFITGADPSSSGGGLAVDSLQANPTTSRVACNPAVVGVFQNETGPVWNTTDCTATVGDVGAAHHPVHGMITLSFRSSGFQQTDAATCTLKAAAAVGTSSCTTTAYSPSLATPAVYPPQGAGSATVTAVYSGETSHLASTGTGTLTLSLHDGSAGTGGHGGRGACRVPNVIGLTRAAAKRAITKAACTLGRVSRKHSSHKKKGRVLSESPKPGTSVARGTAIKLVLGK